jgi:hypothetical protein
MNAAQHLAEVFKSVSATYSSEEKYSALSSAIVFLLARLDPGRRKVFLERLERDAPSWLTIANELAAVYYAEIEQR